MPRQADLRYSFQPLVGNLQFEVVSFELAGSTLDLSASPSGAPGAVSVRSVVQRLQKLLSVLGHDTFCYELNNLASNSEYSVGHSIARPAH